MNIKHTIFAWLCAFSPLMTYAQCYPNKGGFEGSLDSVRLLDTNWSNLKGVGLTKELKAEYGGVQVCRSLSSNRWADSLPGFKQLNTTYRCLKFDDYGVGSYDSTKSSFCKHKSYISVLHLESSRIWRLYSTGGFAGAPVGLIAEFDQKGNRLSAGSGSDSGSGSATPSGGTTSQAASGASPTAQVEAIQNAIGKLFKK